MKRSSKFLESSWPTGGVDAPILPEVQGHQNRCGRCKRDDASQCSASNAKLLQVLSCMHIFVDFFSFLGREAKVPQSRGSFLGLERLRTVNLSSIKFIYIYIYIYLTEMHALIIFHEIFNELSNKRVIVIS